MEDQAKGKKTVHSEGMERREELEPCVVNENGEEENALYRVLERKALIRPTEWKTLPGASEEENKIKSKHVPCLGENILLFFQDVNERIP